ncbi:uncharacterized protein NECHADRAFT_78461 [Fusarium vanettenii 77-13-4]|uniref:Uncharacterized protein n=1 Tax=Fusarium vanettenii (strain ATCC MYA-4622 / CBS 123669 / FGSC 9596 / NRRL 45880 / 77-13-4) TaxID=660122 RepID=C7ZFC6_FUSV7|nr:uncharacterized protein NECHADRAFT_78461 [Fusarium vanettenii 77-13-4]EEU37220.1 predicted protein [Fusarium vanettenii 77-13-4]
MESPPATSPHVSAQASNEDIEASPGVTQSGVDSSLPFRPVLPPNHEGTEPRSTLDENMEEANIPALLQTTTTSKKTKREKQREKRRLKRASERAATGVSTGQKEHQDNTESAKKIRHRPSPAQRSATTLMQMDQWSRLFLNRTSSLSSLTLDCATAEAMSKATEKTWGGKGRKRTFQSAQELDRFVSVKESELRYLKTTLRRASVVQQLPSNSLESKAREALISSLEPLFQAWEANGEESEKDEVLQEAARLFTDTIIPCLEAQLVQLRQRLNSARILEKRLNRVEAWDQLGKEIYELRRSLDKSKGLLDLQEERDHIMIEYRESLEWE